MRSCGTILSVVLAALFWVAASAADAQQRKTQKAAPTKPAKVVGLVCTWSAYSVNKESILIDMANKAAYWINENQNLKIVQFNAGRVVLQGVRNRLQVSQSRMEKKVPMQMIINRISGEFIVNQKAHPYEGPGSCRKQRLF